MLYLHTVIDVILRNLLLSFCLKINKIKVENSVGYSCKGGKVFLSSLLGFFLGGEVEGWPNN